MTIGKPNKPQISAQICIYSLNVRLTSPRCAWWALVASRSCKSCSEVPTQIKITKQPHKHTALELVYRNVTLHCSVITTMLSYPAHGLTTKVCLKRIPNTFALAKAFALCWHQLWLWRPLHARLSILLILAMLPPAQETTIYIVYVHPNCEHVLVGEVCYYSTSDWNNWESIVAVRKYSTPLLDWFTTPVAHHSYNFKVCDAILYCLWTSNFKQHIYHKTSKTKIAISECTESELCTCSASGLGSCAGLASSPADADAAVLSCEAGYKIYIYMCVCCAFTTFFACTEFQVYYIASAKANAKHSYPNYLYIYS